MKIVTLSWTNRYRSARTTCCLFVLLIFTSASAQSGPHVGVAVGLPQGDAFTVNLNAAFPFATFGTEAEPVQLAARADVAIAFASASIPALGVALVLQADASGRLKPYMGGGTGLSLSPGAAAVHLTGYIIAGVRVELTDNWHAALGGNVNLSAYGPIATLSLGIDYTFVGRP